MVMEGFVVRHKPVLSDPACYRRKLPQSSDITAGGTGPKPALPMPHRLGWRDDPLTDKRFQKPYETRRVLEFLTAVPKTFSSSTRIICLQHLLLTPLTFGRPVRGRRRRSLLMGRRGPNMEEQWRNSDSVMRVRSADVNFSKCRDNKGNLSRQMIIISEL